MSRVRWFLLLAIGATSFEINCGGQFYAEPASIEPHGEILILLEPGATTITSFDLMLDKRMVRPDAFKAFRKGTMAVFREGEYRIAVRPGNHELSAKVDGYGTSPLGPKISNGKLKFPLNLEAGQQLRLSLSYTESMTSEDSIAWKPVEEPLYNMQKQLLMAEPDQRLEMLKRTIEERLRTSQ
jgi:hypothetical protein